MFKSKHSQQKRSGVQFPTLAIGAKLHNKYPTAEGERQKEKI